MKSYRDWSSASNRKGRKDGSAYGEQLTWIFKEFGEDRNEEATSVLTNALGYCPESVLRDQAWKTIEDAQEMGSDLLRNSANWKAFEARRTLSPPCSR